MTNLVKVCNNTASTLEVCKKVIAVLIRSHGFRCHELCKHYEEMNKTGFACPYFSRNKDVFVCVEAILETAKKDQEKLDKTLEFYQKTCWT